MQMFALIALSANPAWGGPPSPSSSQEFSGRLEFSGEFTLFPNAGSKECVSGAFPLRKHLRAKRLYRGKLVRIKGELVSYSSLVEQVGATELGWKGTPIPNYCGGTHVILAQQVRLYGEKPGNSE